VDNANRPTANEGLKILSRLVGGIAALTPGESVEESGCRVLRTENGYDVDGEITGTLDGALRLFFQKLDRVATTDLT